MENKNKVSLIIETKDKKEVFKSVPLKITILEGNDTFVYYFKKATKRKGFYLNNQPSN